MRPPVRLAQVSRTCVSEGRLPSLPVAKFAMSILTLPSARSLAAPSLALALGILAIVTVVRLIGLRFSVVDLYIDEAQYWAWSRELAFGYFSKPPLLAWLIAASEDLCGASEACIRAPMPILYLGTSVLVYAIARELYCGRAAFFAALSLGLATGVAFSARIASTDVPLLFFWALALLAYVKLVRAPSWRWAVVLGVAIGLGLLAKYAMIYFPIGIALAACLDRDARRLLRTPQLWVALAIAALLIAPNVSWNAVNGFVTLRHTSENIKGDGVHFDIVRALMFLGEQFAVFGPILFAVLIVAMVRIASPAVERPDRLMLAFAIPPLALVTVAGVVTQTHANWAVPTFVSGTVVAVAILVRYQARTWLGVSLACGVVVQAALLAGDAVAPQVHLPLLANGDVYHRTIGWRVLGEAAGALARRAGARSIVGDDRNAVASLFYYWRDQPEPIFAWRVESAADNTFDLMHPFTAAAPQPVLYVSECPSTQGLGEAFDTIEPLGRLDLPTGPTTKRYYFAFRLDGIHGPIGPRGPCQ